jgi:hypothetical protein
LQSQHKHKQKTSNKTTRDKTSKKQNKSDQLSLFTIKPEFLNTYVDLRTAFAAKTHADERQCLRDQINTIKLRTLRISTRILTGSGPEGQNLVLMVKKHKVKLSL